MTWRMREPRLPTQAPTGSICLLRERTASFVRTPGWRARAVLDLGGLLREERADEERVGAGELHAGVVGRLVDELDALAAVHHDGRAVGRLAVVEAAGVLLHADEADHGAEALADVVAVALHAVAALEDRLAAALDVADDVLAVGAQDRRRHDLADAAGVAALHDVALALVHALDDGLLGGLGGDAAEDAGVHLGLDRVADLGVGVHAAGVGERDVAGADRAVVDDAALPGLDGEGVRVDLDADVAGRAEALLGGGLEGGGDGGEHVRAGDAALALQGLEDGVEVVVHGFRLRWGPFRFKRRGTRRRPVPPPHPRKRRAV